MADRLEYHLRDRVVSLLAYLLIAGVAAIIVIPYILLISSAVDQFTVPSAAKSRLWFSSWLALSTVAISLSLGGGLAVWEYLKRTHPPSWFLGVMLLPIFLPGIIVGKGMVNILGRNGWLNQVLEFLHVEPVQVLFTPWAILIAFAYYNVPLAYIAIRNRLYNSNQHIDNQVAISGGSGWQVIRYAIWPRLRSTVIGVACLIGIYSFTSFELPLVLGGITYQTLEVYIYTLITQQLDLSTAASLAMVQTGTLVALIIGAGIFSRSWPELHRPHIQPASSWLKLVWFNSASIVLLPPLAIMWRAITSHNRSGDGLMTLHNITTLVTDTPFVPSWVFTAGLAIAVVSILCLATLALTYTSTKIYWSVIGLLVVSPIATALGWRLWLEPHPAIAILAFVAMLFPLVGHLIVSNWLSRPPQFEDVLTTLGATTIQQLYHRFRFLFPAFALSCALIISYIFGDIAISSILLDHTHPTAMHLSYSLISAYRFSVADAGMAGILLTIGCISLISAQYFYARRR